MKPYLRLIGDVHGQMTEYLASAKEAEYSIQLGDLNFYYDHLAELSPERHKVLGGNHDNYEKIEGRFFFQTPHFLGDFGVHSVPTVPDIFFVRGGNSIDKKNRMVGYDWWPEEELSHLQLNEALNLYLHVKPDFVISHESPASVIDYVSTLRHWEGEPIFPSMTSRLLEEMLAVHRPKYWIFGHHHRDFYKKIDGTNFFCLNILSYLDISEGGKLEL